MRPIALAALAALALAPLAAAPEAAAQQVEDRDKLAQTGMKFLSVPADPRAAALGDATTSLEGGAEMIFSNPAGLARLESTTDLVVSQTQFIADIDYSHAAIAFRPGRNLGVVAASFAFVDYGELQQTIYADTEQGYLRLGTFAPQAYSAGVGYARAFSDQFSAGGHVKYASEDLGRSLLAYDEEAGETPETGTYQDNVVGTLAYDFGVLYKTGFESLNFAVSARNFAREVVFEEESFQLPLALHIGVSMDVLDLAPSLGDMHRLQVAVDARNPRDFAEQIQVGGEYTFANTLSLRGGYVFPTDEQGINLGAGFQQSLGGVGVGADYAYSNFGVFRDVHRVALRLSF